MCRKRKRTMHSSWSPSDSRRWQRGDAGLGPAKAYSVLVVDANGMLRPGYGGAPLDDYPAVPVVAPTQSAASNSVSLSLTGEPGARQGSGLEHGLGDDAQHQPAVEERVHDHRPRGRDTGRRRPPRAPWRAAREGIARATSDVLTKSRLSKGTNQRARLTASGVIRGDLLPHDARS